MQLKIAKPDETETKVEHHALYRGLSQKALCSAINLPSYELSRRLNHTEPTKDPVHEVIMEMIGSVESNQPSIGKGVFRMIYEYASALGLVDDEPIDLLEMATQRLKAIRERSAGNMSPDKTTTCLARVAALELELSGFTSDLVNAGKANGNKPKTSEQLC